MSVLTVKEIGQTGGDVDDKIARRYLRTYQVVCDSALDGTLQIESAIGIPRIGDIYATLTEIDLGARCSRVAPERDTDNLLLWTVRVEYSSESEDPDKSHAKKPLERRAKVSWLQEDAQRPIQKATKVEVDAAGVETLTPNATIRNSARVPYDPPVEVQDPKQMLQFVKNQATFSPALAYQYRKAVNADPFFGAQPGQWKVRAITAEEAYEEGLAYWVVTYRFEFREEGWDIELLDAGYSELVFKEYNGAGQPVYGPKTLVGLDQTPHAKPQPLNGFGSALPEDAPEESYVYNRYRYYPKKPYAALNLP